MGTHGAWRWLARACLVASLPVALAVMTVVAVARAVRELGGAVRRLW